jgi:hypothetical protein
MNMIRILPITVPSAGIRRLQCILMKTALILGVEVFGGVEFLHPVEPEFESDPWTIAVSLSHRDRYLE